jgi:phosphinothricin acetyltransferase
MCEQSRASLRAAGQALIDGLGTRRVAAMLLYDLQTRDGRPLLGRRLLSEDAGTILNWQRAPGARRYSRNPLVPGDREHNDWMNSRLSSLNAITEILTLEGKPVAMARLDPGEGGYEVSILVAPEAQGRGVGEAALRYLDVLCGEEAATAYVHPDNAPSLRLFRRCGYGSVHGRDLVLLADNSRDGAAIQ